MRGANRIALGLLATLAASLILRVGVVVAGFDSLAADDDSYARLAINWSQSGVFGMESAEGVVRPTAFRPPLYPWLLSWFAVDGRLSLVAVAVFHVVLGVATVGLTYSIAKAVGCTWAWLPATAVACDPLLLRASQLVMTETLAAFMVVLIWRLWLVLVVDHPGQEKPTWWQLGVGGTLGIGFGLAILARPTAAPWAAFCAISLLFINHLSEQGKVPFRRVLKWRSLSCAFVGLGVMACLGPWMIRNASVFGPAIWGTTHGGYTLLLANNSRLYEHFAANGPSRGWHPDSFHAAWASRNPTALVDANFDVSTLPDIVQHSTDIALTSFPPRNSELADDKLAYQIAIETIRERPGLFVVSCFYRLTWFWALWPYSSQFSLAALLIGCWYAIWFVFAVRGAVTLYRSRSIAAWFPAICLVATLTVIHSIYWGNMRMRAPMMSVIYVAASLWVAGSGMMEKRSTTIREAVSP